MSEIPADIENAAVRLCEAHLGWATSEIVMKAILAERQRCADVAIQYFRSDEYNSNQRSAGAMIYVAILAGENA
ncbi:hypothetical protein DK867_02860 [Ochrobactrum sp. POC9]|uniref:hypothetical protein n=1 Tax=Ochrobactrum sp. POC9 TaxID=2203419 RepID=UPI000D707F81|nr:hypothetical protein [Ochrobactrum sp. POC9]PWU76228.1 hypothetical protein DK867_02860 [Ochrobactrum sp. POC9]